MRTRGALAVILCGAWAAVPDSARGQALGIDHEPVGCIVAEQFPRFEACVGDASQVARARVLFKAQGPHWYWVAMEPVAGGSCFQGTLPQPRKDTERIHYYIDTLGRTFGSTRTPEYAPAVATTCSPRMRVAGTAGPAASVLVSAVGGGAPAIPAGFASTGVVTAAGTTGAAAGTGAGAASSGGGGAGKALLVIGGLGAAGAGAYFGLKGGDEADPCDTPNYAISVSPGTSPTFSWSPDCPVEQVQVSRSSDNVRMWSIAAQDEIFRSPVAYGSDHPQNQAPKGARGLVPGVGYVVSVFRHTSDGQQLHQSSASFTP